MIEGIDYATPLGNAAAIRKAGKAFVCRYVSLPGNPKNVTAAEVQDLKRHGLGIVIVFEQEASRVLHGAAQGAADAKMANAQVAAVGLPGCPIYFAADFDAKPQDQHTINQYLVGAASVIGKERVGLYGGYWPLSRAFNADVITYGWQTYAWSGLNIERRAHIYQYKNGQRVAGLSVDLNRALKADYGQWNPPKPKPAPGPSQRELIWQKWRMGWGNYKQYGPANPKVRPYWLKTDAPRAWLARLLTKISKPSS